MALIAMQGYNAATGAKAAATKQILEGVPVMATTQTTGSTGIFGWLDDLGAKAASIAGRAVDAVADGYIADLNTKDTAAVKTPDVTPVPADNKQPIKQSFLEENKEMLMYGGAALVGVVALIYVMRK